MNAFKTDWERSPGLWFAILLIPLLAAISCDRKDDEIIPYGLDSRPQQQCPAPRRPLEDAGIVLQRVFAGFEFEHPVAMYRGPENSSEWYLVEQSGRIKAFSENGSGVRTVLDLSRKVVFKGEAGLLDLAFHPAWSANSYLYLSYTALDRFGKLTSYVSRFQMTGEPAFVDISSERVILAVRQPFANHNGGRIAFGPDGYLYIGLGDGGSGGDPLGSGQDRNVLLGKILRLDVDNGDPYAIPPGNPFIGGGGRAEIFAWGFRNPWRWSFDMQNGDLWVADVGQNRWEEVNLVKAGGNYGWRIREGAHCFRPDPCDASGLIDPLVEYSHQEGCSVTGGFVYHGNENPSLRGSFLFGDYCSGNIWGVFYDGNGNPFRKLLAASGLNISGFAQDRSGEVFVLAYNGNIYRLAANSSDPVDFPPLLSDTGFTDPGDPRRPSACLIPYSVIEPFWSDGAAKERYFFVPAGKRVEVSQNGHLDFPAGSVLVKHFRLNGRLIETRLLIRHEEGEWAGYTYEWDENESDAVLLSSGKTRSVSGQTWIYPSRAQCLQCHNQAAGRSLGLEIKQLNRDFLYPSTGRNANQLFTFDHIGLFSVPLSEPPEQLPRLAASADSSSELNVRARTYLDVNCSYCHRPGGTARGEMDLRWETELSAMSICDREPLLGDLGIGDARLLAPGSPDRSVLIQRLKRSDVYRMPPLGNMVDDLFGIALLEEWIRSLAGCL